MQLVHYIPPSTEGGMGVYWIHPDVCPSIHLPVHPSVYKVSGTFWQLFGWINFMSGKILPLKGGSLDPYQFHVPSINFGRLIVVAKYLAENEVSGTFWKK